MDGCGYTGYMIIIEEICPGPGGAGPCNPVVKKLLGDFRRGTVRFLLYYYICSRWEGVFFIAC